MKLLSVSIQECLFLLVAERSGIYGRELPPVPCDNPAADYIPLATTSVYTMMAMGETLTTQDEEVDEYAYPDYSSLTGESHYQPITPATKDEDNVYVKLTPATQTLNQTNSDTTEKADPILPTDPSELTMEHLAKADPRQAQLWMLLQIQKMVQKMEDMYESAGYLQLPQPLNATEEKQPLPVTQSNQVQQIQPTRKDLYVNLSGITQKKGAYKPLLPLPPPPPIPPKTYKSTRNVLASEISQDSGTQQTFVQEGDAKKEVEMYKKYPQQKMIGKLAALESTCNIFLVY